MAVAVRVYVDRLPDHAWAAGHRDTSFGELYTRFRSDLVELCRRRLGAAGDAEAVAQEAFLRAWLSLDRYSKARPFWPWVATIAQRICIDQVRRRQRELQHFHVQAQLHVGHWPEPERTVETSEEHRAALSALQRLRPREQRLLGLREIDGWSLERLAQVEGMTLDATRSALKRARAALRQSYDRVLAGSLVAFAMSKWSALRGKVARAVHWVPAASSASLAGRGGELLVAVLVAATTSAGPAVPHDGMTPSPPAPAGAWTPSNAPAAPSGAHASGRRLAVVGGRGTPSAAVPAGPTADASSPADGAGGGPGASLSGFDRVASPEDARITGFTVSPSYGDDGTIFASGEAAEECSVQRCPVLFVSHDRGSSWTRLPADRYGGGRILLAPDFPRDARLFASGPSGLQVSADGGGSFVPLTATGGDAAMSPGFSSGDGRIIVGGTPRWTYDDDEGIARPAVFVAPPSSALTGAAAFAPDVDDGSVVLVGGTTTTPSSTMASAVFGCRSSSCSRLAVLPGLAGAPNLRLAPTFSASGEVWAWLGGHVLRSSDGGHDFERLGVAAGASVRDVAYGDGGVRYVAADEGPGSKGGLFRTADGGTTWSARRDTPVEAVAVLPDGRLLIAAGTAGGVACSGDDGATWQARCA